MKFTSSLIAAALLIAACAQYESIEVAPVTRAERAQIERITADQLKDPGAAQFRNIQRVNATLTDQTRQNYVCGEVNGKNLYGAYTGFKVFRGKFIGDRFFLDIITNHETDAIYRMGCAL